MQAYAVVSAHGRERNKKNCVCAHVWLRESVCVCACARVLVCAQSRENETWKNWWIIPNRRFPLARHVEITWLQWKESLLELASVSHTHTYTLSLSRLSLFLSHSISAFIWSFLLEIAFVKLTWKSFQNIHPRHVRKKLSRWILSRNFFSFF